MGLQKNLSAERSSTSSTPSFIVDSFQNYCMEYIHLGKFIQDFLLNVNSQAIWRSRDGMHHLSVSVLALAYEDDSGNNFYTQQSWRAKNLQMRATEQIE